MANTSPKSKKIAWVTGAGTGIGRGVAKRLAEEGWHVAISARTARDLDSLAAEVPGQITAFLLDVTDEAANVAVVDRIEEALGPIDLVILNAGTYFPVTAKNFKVSNFRKTVDVNLNGTANGLGAVLPYMKKRRRGHIAIMASVAGFVGLPTSMAYGATKAALNNMAEALKPELEVEGITLTVINPGFVKTPLTDKNEFPMPFLVELDEAVDQIVGGLKTDRFEITFPWQMAFSMRLLGMLPHWLVFAITRRMVN